MKNMIRALLLALIVFLRTLCLEAALGEEDFKPTGEALLGYYLVWSDEFNGLNLDTQKWNYRTDSKLWSTQLPQNIRVADGTLKIVLKKESANGKQYTGGGIISKETFLYGYYEARFRVPPGAGWHASFWAQKHDGSGGTNPQLARQEIDFCEQDSVKPTDYSAGVIDWSASKKRTGFGRKHVHTPDLSSAFHIWGCEFTATEVRFFFDGKLTHQTDATKFAHGEQHIWLTAIAASLGGTKEVDESKLPAEAVFDYVRYFRKNADK